MTLNHRKLLIFGLIAAFALTLAANLLVSASVEAAPPPGGPPQRPGCRPGSPDWPECTGAGITFNVGWQPGTAVIGQPLTYILSLNSGGVQDATEVEIDLPLLANQTFSSFDAGTTGWSLLTAPADVTSTVRVAVGNFKSGEHSTAISITTIFPDLNQPIVRQYATVKWRDGNGVTSRGGAMAIPIDLSQRPQPPVPTAPPLPTPAPSPFANAAPPFLPVSDPGPGVDGPKNWYFPVTSHTLNDQIGFLTYWLNHGSVTVLGFPLSEVYTDGDTGFQSQYFERGVLEYHPKNLDPYKVEIRSLGREAGQVQPAIVPGQPPSAGSTFYPQTGHWLDARFAAFWQSQGGLAQFGYPIGEPVTQADGKVVQWFERARFEYTLSATGYPQVLLGLVGHESAVGKKYLAY